MAQDPLEQNALAWRVDVGDATHMGTGPSSAQCAVDGVIGMVCRVIFPANRRPMAKGRLSVRSSA